MSPNSRNQAFFAFLLLRKALLWLLATFSSALALLLLALLALNLLPHAHAETCLNEYAKVGLAAKGKAVVRETIDQNLQGAIEAKRRFGLELEVTDIPPAKALHALQKEFGGEISGVITDIKKEPLQIETLKEIEIHSGSAEGRALQDIYNEQLRFKFEEIERNGAVKELGLLDEKTNKTFTFDSHEAMRDFIHEQFEAEFGHPGTIKETVVQKTITFQAKKNSKPTVIEAAYHFDSEKQQATVAFFGEKKNREEIAYIIDGPEDFRNILTKVTDDGVYVTSEAQISGSRIGAIKIEKETSLLPGVASSKPYYNNFDSIEVITSPLYHHELPEVKKLMLALRQAGAKTETEGRKLGLHINIEADPDDASGMGSFVRETDEKYDPLLAYFSPSPYRAVYYQRHHEDFVTNIGLQTEEYAAAENLRVFYETNQMANGRPQDGKESAFNISPLLFHSRQAAEIRFPDSELEDFEKVQEQIEFGLAVVHRHIRMPLKTLPVHGEQR